MKIDMHCHVKEGSIDSRVGIEEYIEILKKKGFQGMVITDHDTYNGYRYWKENIKGKKHTDFVVLKGIEYDTRDAGHILVIMPEGVKIRLLEMRGMPLALLIDLVHRNGGVLGLKAYLYSRVSPMCLTYNAHRQSCRSAMMRREVLCR